MSSLSFLLKLLFGSIIIDVVDNLLLKKGTTQQTNVGCSCVNGDVTNTSSLSLDALHFLVTCDAICNYANNN
jgi:hypothetical protein